LSIDQTRRTHELSQRGRTQARHSYFRSNDPVALLVRAPNSVRRNAAVASLASVAAAIASASASLAALPPECLGGKCLSFPRRSSLQHAADPLCADQHRRQRSTDDRGSSGRAREPAAGRACRRAARCTSSDTRTRRRSCASTSRSWIWATPACRRSSMAIWRPGYANLVCRVSSRFDRVLSPNCPRASERDAPDSPTAPRQGRAARLGEGRALAWSASRLLWVEVSSPDDASAGSRRRAPATPRFAAASASAPGERVPGPSSSSRTSRCTSRRRPVCRCSRRPRPSTCLTSRPRGCDRFVCAGGCGGASSGHGGVRRRRRATTKDRSPIRVPCGLEQVSSGPRRFARWSCRLS
jgi:hypothetical protein